MSEPPSNANSDSEGFTCSALFMCLCPPGRSSKKPEEEASTSHPQVETGPAPSQQPTKEAEQEPPHEPSRATSLEKFDYASLHSGNNIVFDFVVEEREEAAEQAAATGAPVVHGYCPSPCFDLPVELIRAGERYGSVATARDAPVTAAFVFDDYQGAALKKMASCLASGVEVKEARSPHHVRFLSASDPSVPPSRGIP